MGWQDLGIVFSPNGAHSWMKSHAYVPTACHLGDRIRVFAAFWDENRIGRIGYVDFSESDPTRVIAYSREPVLSVGAPGAFDEHGVTPMSIVIDGDAMRLYYAGWQRSESVRYFLFTGMANSSDGGSSFSKASDVPVLDRVRGNYQVRTGFIGKFGPIWKAWIAQSEGLVQVAGKLIPSYSLGYLESRDGIVWPSTAKLCFSQGENDVFGYGRSAIWVEGSRYHCMLSVRRRSGYVIEYSFSSDGIDWSEPARSNFALLPQNTIPQQSETMFPSIVMVSGTRYVFYNGDAFGKEGIRCATWRE
jgi:hypothetical protein